MERKKKKKKRIVMVTIQNNKLHHQHISPLQEFHLTEQMCLIEQGINP